MANKNNKKQVQKQDLGYKAYIAAFAVMLLIIIAAACVLSGCLDKLIFGDMLPSGNNDPDSSDISSDSETDVPPISTDTDEPDDTSNVIDTEADSTDTETEKVTEKVPETTEKTPETEKSPETEKKEETTVPESETTTPETETSDNKKDPVGSDEIFDLSDENLRYNFANGGLSIIGYDNSSATEIKIPKTLDGINVTAIAHDAFKNMRNIEKITVSYGVTSIGDSAMSDCTELSYVYIPESVTAIAENAFDGSSNVVINCKKGSFAERYANLKGIECNAK